MATAAAHFHVQPRLALYLGKGKDFYDLLTASTDDRPGIVQFTADAAADPDLQDAALRLSARYAGIPARVWRGYILCAYLGQQRAFRQDLYDALRSVYALALGRITQHPHA